MKKFIAVILLFGLLLAFAPSRKEAQAQQGGGSDPYASLGFGVQCGQNTLSANAAVIFTAVSGKKIVVRAIPHYSSVQAGVVSFTDGSGGAILFQIYCSANGSPAPITMSELGAGFATTAGNGLYAVTNGTSGSFVIDAVTQQK